MPKPSEIIAGGKLAVFVVGAAGLWWLYRKSKSISVSDLVDSAIAATADKVDMRGAVAPGYPPSPETVGIAQKDLGEKQRFVSDTVESLQAFWRRVSSTPQIVQRGTYTFDASKFGD